MIEYIKAKKLVHSASGGQGWFGVTHNMNIYRGCDHGCIYCDSRSSCYQIDDFDRIRVKEDAPTKVDQELSTKRKKGVIGLGGMNDPYNHFEIELEYTRQILQSINKYQFGVHIITKSDLVARDIDLLKQIQSHSPVNVGITITTASDRLQSRIERNVTPTSKRYQTLKELKQAGLYCGVLIMPILPFINDTIENIEALVEMAHEANVDYIYPSFGVTLRDNQRQHFFNKIGPELTKRYIETYNDSYMCVSPKHQQLQQKFVELCEKYGIVYTMKDIIKNMHQSVTQKQETLF